MTTVRRNSKEFAKAFAESKNVKVYSLDNGFEGVVYPTMDFKDLKRFYRLSKDIKDGSILYTASVHSNLWYTWTV